MQPGARARRRSFLSVRAGASNFNVKRTLNAIELLQIIQTTKNGQNDRFLLYEQKLIYYTKHFVTFRWINF